MTFWLPFYCWPFWFILINIEKRRRSRTIPLNRRGTEGRDNCPGEEEGGRGAGGEKGRPALIRVSTSRVFASRGFYPHSCFCHVVMLPVFLS